MTDSVENVSDCIYRVLVLSIDKVQAETFSTHELLPALWYISLCIIEVIDQVTILILFQITREACIEDAMTRLRLANGV